MIYQKITAIFRQVEEGFSISGKRLGGIARIETISGISDLYLSLINFSGVFGDYFAFAVDGSGKVFKFPLGKSPSSTVCHFPTPPNLEKGIAVGICLVKDGIPLTIAFSKSDDFMMSLSDYKKKIASELLSFRKQTKSETDAEKTECENASTVYDDEAVATINYFDFDKSIEDKLKIIKESDNDSLRLKNELPYNLRQEKTKETPPYFDRFENEKDFTFSPSNKKPTFYDTVKEQLDKIFLSFPREESLESAFFDSKFAKVDYSDGKYYVVGIIKEQKQVKYLCYGVPAAYSSSPPEQLKGFCSFIPLSLFNLKGDGYWMIFQDAISGKRIKPE